MNLQFYLEKLFSSEEFQKFKKENPNAFLCSGFFSIDKKAQDNQQHLDFYVPNSNKMFSFKLTEKIELVPVENFGKDFIPEKITDNLNFDFNNIEKKIESRMFDEKINKKIEKIILSLQTKDKKNLLIGTVFISGLGMLKIKFDLDKREFLEFEKKSFFDMMKIIRK